MTQRSTPMTEQEIISEAFRRFPWRTQIVERRTARIEMRRDEQLCYPYTPSEDDRE
jgi:hypothetical protein